VLKLEEELRIAGEINDNQRRARVTGELQQRLKIYLDSLNAIPERELELVRQRRRYDSANDNFQLLQRNLTRARIVAGGDSEKIRLIEFFERPTLRDTPVSPKKRLIMMLSVILGAVLAITWAVAADYLDHTLRSPRDIERYLGLRLIGSFKRIA
jgi:tyrosine-protein kinase Etk/Wzc